MQGKHHICLQIEKSVFELDLEYKVTLIIGDSGTGKTTMSRSADKDPKVLLPVTIPLIAGADTSLFVSLCDNRICYFDEDTITYCYAKGNYDVYTS